MLESGHGVTCVVPIHEGDPCRPAISRHDLAGNDITDYLVKTLNDSGHSFSTSAELECVKDIKEKVTYIAYDYEQDLNKARAGTLEDKIYELPLTSDIHASGVRRSFFNHLLLNWMHLTSMR